MNEQTNQDNDENDLVDLFVVLLKRKKMILTISLTAMLGVVLFSIFSLILPPEASPYPNTYEPRALMLINDNKSSGSGLSSLLSSGGLSGLASLAGLNVDQAATNKKLAVFLTTTNSFLDAIVDKFALLSRYKINGNVRANSRDQLRKKLLAEVDATSGVFSIQFNDIDPVFAQSVVNYAVDYLENRFDEMGIDNNKREKQNLEINLANTYAEIINLEQQTHALGKRLNGSNIAPEGSSFVLEMTRLNMELNAQKEVYIQLKTQYELLKVTMASETPIFQVLEYAEVPDRKSGPSRGMLCMVVSFLAFFLSVFLAFLLNVIDNLKNDSKVMLKLGNPNKGMK